MVMVKVGKTEAGASMAQSHTGHLTGSDAVTQRGVPPVRRHARRRPRRAARRVGRARAHAAREACRRGRAARRARACACTRSPAAPARTWPTCSPTPACASPTSPRRRRPTLHDGLIPAYLRVSNPVDCGGPPVADRRGRAIIDAILADKNVDIVIVPITGAVAMFSDPLTRDVIEASKTTDKPIFVIWGAPSGTDDTYYQRLLDGGLPTFRTFSNCVAAVKAYVDYWTFAARYRSPFKRRADHAARPRRKKARKLLDGLQPGEALSEWGSKQLLQAYGIKTSQRRAVHVGRRRGEGREGDRLPGRDEGVVARPAAQERRRARARRRGVGRRKCAPPTTTCSPRRRRADKQGAHRRRARVRDGDAAASRCCRRVARRAVRPGRHRRHRRHLHRGVRRRDVPRPAVRRRRGAARARTSCRATSCSKASAARSPPTSTRSSTRS